MTSVAGTTARPRAGALAATVMIALPLVLALMCLAARLDIITLSQSIRAALLFAMLLALMATGMPISIALGLSVLTYLFILSRVARRMIAFATSLIGHWYGGLGLAGVVACALFAAISGSSVATVVGIGSIILPAIVEHGYPQRFGVGVIATSGALGILFPPSINLVIFAVATSGMQPRGPTGEIVDSASVGQLFIAGVVPGLMLATR